MRASVPLCMCVSNWAVLRVWRALESMLVGHQATKPPSHRASEQPPWWGGRQPPCHLVSLPSCPPPPPLHRAPLSPGWNVPPRRGAPRDVCLTTNKGFRLGAQVRKTCAFLCAVLQHLAAKVSTSCFYEESHLGGQGNQSQQHPAPDILLLPCCLQVLAIACWFQGVSCFYLPLQASTTPTYKAYTRYGEDRGGV